MNERPARTFEEDRRGLAVDVLSWSRKQLLPVWALEEFGRNKRADAKRSPVRFNKTRSTSDGRRPRPTPDPATPTPKPKHRRTCRSPRTHGRTDGGEPASQPAAAEKVSSGSWAVGGELTRKRSLSLSVLHSPPPPPPSPPLPHSIPLGSVWNPGRGKPPAHGILPPPPPPTAKRAPPPRSASSNARSVRPRPDPVKSSCWQTP